MSIETFRVKAAVDTIAHALQSDGAVVQLIEFDADGSLVRIAANLEFDCERCTMTGDQLQSLVKEMVEDQLGRPVSVELAPL